MFYQDEVNHSLENLDMMIEAHGDVVETDAAGQPLSAESRINKIVAASVEKSKPQWLRSLKDLKNNWVEILKGAGNRQISNLLSVFVSFGFCAIESCTFTVAGFDLISKDMIKIHKSAGDMTSAVLDSLVYMAEGGWRVYNTGDISSFVLGNFGADDLQERYLKVLYYWNLLKDGNLRKTEDIEDIEFHHLLNTTIQDCKSAKLTLKGFENKVMCDYILALERIKIEFASKRQGGGNRYNPFGIQIYGLSSQGKSELQDQLLDAIMTSADLPLDRDRRQPINANSEFMDSWQSDTLVGIFPDFANETPGFVSTPLTRILLDFFSPERFVVNKADLPSKGMVEVNAKIGVINTNKLDLDAHQYSNLPYSVQRRPSVIIEVFAKERFQLKRNGVSSGVDSAKVREYELQNPNHVFSDIWDVNLLEVSRPDHEDQPGIYKILTGPDGKEKKMVSMAEVIQYTTDKFLAWDENQKKILERGSKRVDYLKNTPREELICGVNGCKYLKCICTKHQDFKPLAHDSFKTTVKNGEEEPKAARRQRHKNKSERNDRTWRRNKKPSKNKIQVEPHSNMVERPTNEENGDERRSWGDMATEWKRYILSAPTMAYTNTDDGTEIGVGTTGLHPADTTSVRWTERDYLTPLIEWTNQTERVYRLARTYYSFIAYTRMVPDMNLKDSAFTRLLHAWMYRYTRTVFCVSAIIYVVVSLLILYCLPALVGGPLWAIFSIVYFVFHVSLARLLGRSYIDFIALNLQETWIHQMGRTRSLDCLTSLLWICPVLVGIVAMWKIVRYFTSSLAINVEAQGNLTPEDEKDIDCRLAEKNPYKEVVVLPLSTTPKSKCIRIDDLKAKAKKNQFVFNSKSYFDDTIGDSEGVITFVETNFFLLNKHYLVNSRGMLAKKIVLTCQRIGIPKGAVGKQFTITVEPRHWRLLEESDVAVCYTTVGGSFGNLLDYFVAEHPTRLYNGTTCIIQDHEKDPVSYDFKGHIMSADGKTNLGAQRGKGQLAVVKGLVTCYGMCGSLYYSQGKAPCITGIHSGGATGREYACISHVTHAEILSSIEDMTKDINVFRTAADGDYDFTFAGVEYGAAEKPFKKSAVNYLDKSNVDSNVQYHGTTGRVAKTGTNFRPTAIAKIVLEEANLPNIWNPPKMVPNWWGWQQTLQGLDEPVGHFDAEILMKSVNDYVAMISPALENDYWQQVGPLVDDVNLKGLPGKRFWEAVNLSTKFSFHKTGKKRRYIEELESDGFYQHNWKLKPEEEKAIIDYIVTLSTGRRGYPVAKGTYKDEALTGKVDASGEVVAKEKCRVMYSNSLIFTYVLRWLFLPIIIGIQCDPIRFGVAVGINRKSPEWHQMEEFLNSIEGGYLGGDYKKYDQNMPAQLILAALGIYIDIAKRLPQYHAFHIHLMEMIAADLVYAYIDMGGALISLMSSGHISGNSLTVHINSTVNHLLLRYCWFTNNDTPFHEDNKVIVYGDDNTGVCKKGNNFDNKVIADILGPLGIGYTNPDKGAEVKPWLDDLHRDFLKCKTHHHEEINCKVGYLDIMSAYRPLVCETDDGKSGLTEEERNGMNLDNFCRELWAHPESNWNVHYPIIKRITERAGLENHTSVVDKPRSWHFEKWEEQYGAERDIVCGPVNKEGVVDPNGGAQD
jgi:hypothetical protein